MSSSAKQDAKFGTAFLDQILDWVAGEFEPEDIFEEKRLAQWATDMGYIKEES